MRTRPCRTASKTAAQRARAITFRLLVAAGLVGSLGGGAAAAPDAVVLTAMPVALVDAPGPRQVDLFIDFAVILRIAGDISTIVVGNASIADASVVASGTIALTGKAVGTTNIVVLRPDGSVLSEFRVQVGAQKPGVVTVRRALLPSSYACTAASCQRSDGGSENGPSPAAAQ